VHALVCRVSVKGRGSGGGVSKLQDELLVVCIESGQRHLQTEPYQGREGRVVAAWDACVDRVRDAAAVVRDAGQERAAERVLVIPKLRNKCESKLHHDIHKF
jgi:hypothetical protein